MSILVKQSLMVHVEYLIFKYPPVFAVPYLGELHFEAVPIWTVLTLFKENKVPMVLDLTTEKIQPTRISICSSL